MHHLSNRCDHHADHRPPQTLNGLLHGAVLLALLLPLGMIGCIPQTTVKATKTLKTSAQSGQAEVVFLRPAGWTTLPQSPAGQRAEVPLGQGMSYVRVLDETGRVLADLRFNEFTVARVKPGEHTFYVYNWADAETTAPLCVGVMRAQVAAGRRYAARIVVDGPRVKDPIASIFLPPDDTEERAPSSGFGLLASTRHHVRQRHVGNRACRRLDLLRVSADERGLLRGWLARSGQRRMDPKRTPSWLLDRATIVPAILKAGGRRLNGEQPWPGAASTLIVDDGEPMAGPNVSVGPNGHTADQRTR